MQRENTYNVHGLSPARYFEFDGDWNDTIYLIVRVLASLLSGNNLSILPKIDYVLRYQQQLFEILAKDFSINLNDKNLFYVDHGIPDKPYLLELNLLSAIEGFAEKLQSLKSPNILIHPYHNTPEWQKVVDRLEKILGGEYNIQMTNTKFELAPHIQNRMGFALNNRKSSENPYGTVVPDGLKYPESYCTSWKLYTKEGEKAAKYNEIINDLKKYYNELGKGEVFVKAVFSAGGFGTICCTSEKEIEDAVNKMKGDGLLEWQKDSIAPIEIQKSIGKIERHFSVQLYNGEMMSPGITEQIIKGTHWIGNKYNLNESQLTQKAIEQIKLLEIAYLENGWDFSGYRGIDFGLTKDGELWIIEHNGGRPPAANLAIKAVEGLKVHPKKPYIFEKFHESKINNGYELKDAWADVPAKHKFCVDQGKGIYLMCWIPGCYQYIIVGDDFKEIECMKKEWLQIYK